MGISMTGIDLWNITGQTWSLGSQYLPTKPGVMGPNMARKSIEPGRRFQVPCHV